MTTIKKISVNIQKENEKRIIMCHYTKSTERKAIMEEMRNKEAINI